MDSAIQQGGSEGILPDPMSPALLNTLEEINKALDDLQPLPSRIEELRMGTLDKEAEILKVILQKITPLIPLLCGEIEAYHRDELILHTKTERVNFEESVNFYSEHELILYEGGKLVDHHRYGEGSTAARKIGWEMSSDAYLTPVDAITRFGFEDIVKGVIKIIQDVRNIFILKADLESKLLTLMETLEALQ